MSGENENIYRIIMYAVFRTAQDFQFTIRAVKKRRISVVCFYVGSSCQALFYFVFFSPPISFDAIKLDFVMNTIYKRRRFHRYHPNWLISSERDL